MLSVKGIELEPTTATIRLSEEGREGAGCLDAETQ